MADRLLTFADADKQLRTFSTIPALVQSPPVEGQTPAVPASRIQVAKIGKFKHPRYGPFKVDQDTFDAFRRNLQGYSGGEVAIDFDHTPDRGGETRARGWIKALDQRGEDGQTDTPDELWATVEWTPTGAEAVGNREYRYISPTWSMAFVDEYGNKLGPTLLRAALTNDPFFSRMAAVTFARDDLALLEEDERLIVGGEMTDFATFAKALDLAEDSAEDKILASLAELVEKAKTAPAEDEKVVKASRLTDLEAAESKLTDTDRENVKLASRLDAIEAERADERFDSAFKTAMDDGKVGAAQRDQLKGLFDKDHDGTLAFIKDMPKLVQTAARGELGKVDDAEAPSGTDADSFALDRKVQTYMTEHPEIGYAKALDLVRSQEAAR